MIATMKNAEDPGCFEDTLNSLLKANNVPSFNKGGISPPVFPAHAMNNSIPNISHTVVETSQRPNAVSSEIVKDTLKIDGTQDFTNDNSIPTSADLSSMKIYKRGDVSVKIHNNKKH